MQRKIQSQLELCLVNQKPIKPYITVELVGPVTVKALQAAEDKNNKIIQCQSNPRHIHVFIDCHDALTFTCHEHSLVASPASSSCSIV